MDLCTQHLPGRFGTAHPQLHVFMAGVSLLMTASCAPSCCKNPLGVLKRSAASVATAAQEKLTSGSARTKAAASKAATPVISIPMAPAPPVHLDLSAQRGWRRINVLLVQLEDSAVRRRQAVSLAWWAMRHQPLECTVVKHVDPDSSVPWRVPSSAVLAWKATSAVRSLLQGVRSARQVPPAS